MWWLSLAFLFDPSLFPYEPSPLFLSPSLLPSPSSFFFLKIYFIYYMWVHCSCLQTLQKRASDFITDGYEPPCGCWDLNLGPLEEQSVLLTAEPSHQPPPLLFFQLSENSSFLPPLKCTAQWREVYSPGCTAFIAIGSRANLFLCWVPGPHACLSNHADALLLSHISSSQVFYLSNSLSTTGPTSL
jgi:hypothetical protein